MGYVNRFLSEVSEGIYLWSMKYETEQSVRSIIWFRTMAAFYLYYVSIVILLIGIRVKMYGPFKPSIIEAGMYMFGIYFLIYRFFIRNSVYKGNSNIIFSEKEISVKIKKSINVFLYGILAFSMSFFVVYLLYRK